MLGMLNVVKMLQRVLFVVQLSPGGSPKNSELSASVEVLCSQGAAQLLASWLLETLQMRLSSSVVPEFWCGLKQVENEVDERGRVWVLLTTFRTLLERLEPFLGKLSTLRRFCSHV